jgi:hypothetical protein
VAAAGPVQGRRELERGRHGGGPAERPPAAAAGRRRVVGEDALDVGEDAELLDERLAARQQLRLLRRVELVHLVQLLVRLLQELLLLRTRSK